MKLEVWKGDWGLASVDLECLQVLAYTKFLGKSIEFEEKNNPYRTPSGKFPVFRDGKKTFNKFHDITDYLKSQNYNVDSHLTEEQLSDVWAFRQYLETNLFPCLEYAWWVDETNFAEIVRPWYAKVLPFPFNFYYPKVFKDRAIDMVDTMYGEFWDKKIVHCELYMAAEKCFEDLSTRLGSNEFFFGSRPSSLDATVFAYLAPVLKMPQKNPTLQKNLRTYDNLVQFVTRISQRFFSAKYQEYENIRKKALEEASLAEKNPPSQHVRNKLFAGLFAALAMLGFAISNGLLQINLKEEFESASEFNDMFEMDDEDN